MGRMGRIGMGDRVTGCQIFERRPDESDLAFRAIPYIFDD